MLKFLEIDWLNEINSTDFSDIEWVDGTNKIDTPDVLLDNFSDTGLQNTDFALLGLIKNNS